jgi:hypothetical protein
MYRNTSTIFRLVEALKDCHYIRSQAEFVTQDQLRRIYEYLDDVAIDLFFRNFGRICRISLYKGSLGN